MMKPLKNSKSLKAQLKKTAEHAHGAGQTRYARKSKVSLLDAYFKKNNIQITRIDQIKARHIEAYIQERLAQGISKRTLQNDMAAIRQTLRVAGRDKLAGSDRISNKALGLSGASREGTRVAISDAQYQQIYALALQKNQGLAAAIGLARTLGLRSEEAVQSCQSLNTWKDAIEKGEAKLKIVFGTKGGRDRFTTVIDRQQVQQAVDFALSVAAQQNGKLIDKPNLKQAMTYWRNHTRAIRLKGQISPHSLRYAFAQEVIVYYQQQGYSRKEALALTSMDLGHGDNRGAYVRRVYSRKAQ